MPSRWRRSPARDLGEFNVLERIDRRHRYWLWLGRFAKALVLLAAVLMVLACGAVIWLGAPPNWDSPAAESEEPGALDADGEEAQADAGPKAGGGKAPKPDPIPPALVDLSALRSKVLPSVVSIERDNGRGTGFIVKGGLVATAYHVVEGRKATVVFHDGERVKVVEHVACDRARDVAVLRIETKRKLQPLELATAMPKPGETVASFQFGGGEVQGKVVEIGKGEIAGRTTRSELLRTTLNTVPGWSGGPVLNLKGKVVGINSVLDGTPFEAPGIRIATQSGAVPATVLQELLAIEDLTQVLRINKNDADRYDQRARLYEAKSDLERAIADYTEVIRLKPRAAVYADRARVYTAKGDLSSAIADYTNALGLDRNLVEAYRGRAAAYEAKDNLGGAIADYAELGRLVSGSEAASVGQKLARLHRERARTLAAKGKFDEAIADCTDVIRLDPKDPSAYRFRGELRASKGDYERAAADYTEALRLKPGDAEVYRLRGTAYTAKGDHDKAIADFTEAIRLQPDSDETYCARGAVYGARREFNKAVADFTRALRINPWNEKAYHNRASAYTELGEEGKASEDSMRARELKYWPR